MRTVATHATTAVSWDPGTRGLSWSPWWTTVHQRPPHEPSDRVGDDDRSRTTAALGRALAGGYLDPLEYGDRLEAVVAGRTRADLAELTADLPTTVVDDPGAGRRRARAGLRLHAAAAALAALVCWVVWLAVGSGSGEWYPWAIWPTVGMGCNVTAHALLVHRLPRGGHWATPSD